MVSRASSLSRRLAVITGASSDVGYELAKLFAAQGHDLVLAAEGRELVESAAALEELGSRVTALQVDLSTSEGVRQLYSVIQQTGRRVDALVINAAVRGDPSGRKDLQAELDLSYLHIASSVHLAKLVLEDMKVRDQGRILLTAPTTPGPFESVYAASRDFLISFADTLRSELEDTHVVAVARMPESLSTTSFHRPVVEEHDGAEVVARQAFEALMSAQARPAAPKSRRLFEPRALQH